METLINFFTLRPVFTLYGLRVLWGAYIIDQLLPTISVISNPNFSAALIKAIVILLLQACLNVAVFRLLLEVAAAVLTGRSMWGRPL